MHGYPHLMVWDMANPTVEKIEIRHTTPLSYKNVGLGIEVPQDGTVLTIEFGQRRAWFHQSATGMFSLYYAQVGTKLYLSTYLWEVRAAAGVPVKQTEAGVLYVFKKQSPNKVYRYKGDEFTVPAIDYTMDTLDKGADRLLEGLVTAAKDQLKCLGTNDVALLLSGGTDSLLTAIGLKEAGANIHCISAGLSMEDFDPNFAAQYAKQLGLPFEFVAVPQVEGPEMDALIEQTIMESEIHDYSNFLMAYCCAEIRNKLEARNLKIQFHGYFADLLVGNSLGTWGRYNKEFPEGHPKRNSNHWRDFRVGKNVKVIPNTLWIEKLAKKNGGDWASPFFHPAVTNVMLSAPIELVPPGPNKLIYHTLCDRYVKDGGWHSSRKIGFYTGAGVGKLRLNDGPLNDQRISKIFEKVKP